MTTCATECGCDCRFHKFSSSNYQVAFGRRSTQAKEKAVCVLQGSQPHRSSVRGEEGIRAKEGGRNTTLTRDIEVSHVAFLIRAEHGFFLPISLQLHCPFPGCMFQITSECGPAQTQPYSRVGAAGAAAAVCVWARVCRQDHPRPLPVHSGGSCSPTTKCARFSPSCSTIWVPTPGRRCPSTKTRNVLFRWWLCLPQPLRQMSWTLLPCARSSPSPPMMLQPLIAPGSLAGGV